MRDPHVVSEETGIGKGIIEFLSSKGYKLIKRLGEGHTSDVYLAEYVSGDVKKFRAVKIRKKDIDPDSICTLINLSKKDVAQAEVLFSNKISHPNIINVLDHLKNDGGDIVVEEYFNGQTLEERIRSRGPISDDREFHRIFSQVLDAEKYLMWDPNIIHRDMKPSNIMVNSDDHVKIIDLQNCGSRQLFHEEMFPTRGGTQYTHPELINALFTQKPSHASERTEIYSLAATMYFALTGKEILPYKVTRKTDGSRIIIDDTSYFIGLSLGDMELSEFDKELHEKELKHALKLVPRKYRKMLHKALTSDTAQSYRDIGQFAADFEKTKSFTLSDIGVKLRENFKLYTGIAAVTIVGIGMGWFIATRDNESKPTMFEITNNRFWHEYNMEDIDFNDKEYMWSVLKGRAEDLKEDISRLNDENNLLNNNNITGFSDFSYSVHGIPRRMTSSLLRAVALADSAETMKFYAEERMYPTYVPKSVIRSQERYVDYAENYMDLSEAVARSIMFFKTQVGADNIVEAFSQYFCSREDISNAMIRSGGTSYFPHLITDNGKPGDDSTKSGAGTVVPGYYERLSTVQRNLVETAVILYQLTDDEGNVDFNKVPRMIPKIFNGQYEEHLGYRLIPKDQSD